MATIVTFEKSRRLSAREPLVYVSRDLGGWMLLLPWFTVTIHRGDWRVKPAPAPYADPDPAVEAALLTVRSIMRG